MFRNYVKIAWRNIAKSKTFSFINVLGLALGMTSSLLILLWVQDERSIDQFHANGPRIYQVMENQQWTGNDISTTPSTPGPLALALTAEVPEVEKSVKITWQEEQLLSVGDKAYKEKGRYASPDLFQIFSFPFVQGNPKTAIVGPSSIVISEKVALKLFGRTDVVGRTVRVNNKDDHQVTGVVKDIPETSSLKFDFVLPETPYEKENEWLTKWENNGIRTFALLHQNADVNVVNAKILNMVRKHDKNVTTITTFMFPYEEAYLHSKFTNGKPDGGRIEYVRLFTIVAIFLLIIACINFMNLATARSAKRAKEVGIRKVVGAERSYLVGQFVGEAVLMSLLSLLIAMILVPLLLPVFNTLTEKHISIQYTNPFYWLTLLGLALITGLVSGSYPALFLSSLQPVRVLKGTLRFNAGAVLFRQGLVVFQFSLSLLLIIGTLIAGRQVDYIRTKNLGLDRENVVYMTLEGDLSKRFDSFREELVQAPGIQSVSSSGNDPMEIGSSTIGVEWKGKPEGDKTLFTNMAVSYDFIKTMKIRLLAGRDFSKTFVTDSTNYLVNEEAARRMGMKNPVGQDLKFWSKSGKIIGLMKNFHVNSLRVAIEPLIIRLDSTNYTLLVRTHPGQTEQALKSMERLAKQFNPAYPFDYRFADESFREQYKSETLIGKLANYFAIIAIFIACLGLFGLAMFTAEQRTKEIGVRKVLGASVTSIVALLSKDFLKLVLISIFIASPLAWYAMHQWLADFAYRIDIEWWVFVLAGLLAVGIAQLTVSFQSIKAALMNPVKSLRSE
ncbi:ABC transporter permease [Spirosoma endbachense]|uniref:FtsX-like permease family protein n=1 Tax=Spirosoma endbachense TaxID=2666025 RepID=A0A6P1VS72_9BACT|nr:ABC transporter permease [Spirosoma endbachense]QHV94469.1 FtsX-like permease family protein [Spirosoma endbachense]